MHIDRIHTLLQKMVIEKEQRRDKSARKTKVTKFGTKMKR